MKNLKIKNKDNKNFHGRGNSPRKQNNQTLTTCKRETF